MTAKKTDSKEVFLTDGHLKGDIPFKKGDAVPNDLSKAEIEALRATGSIN